MDFVIGIDVGGFKKGFHISVLTTESKIYALTHFKSVSDIIIYIKQLQTLFKGNCLGAAIDSPAQSLIKSEHTRLAERELVRLGYRVLWTPRKKEYQQEWMKNGEQLWGHLKKNFPDLKIIETFPNANSDLLFHQNISLNISLFMGKPIRYFYKDFIDSVICALVAFKSLDNETILVGKNDILNPVHLLKIQKKEFVLAIIKKEDQVLLGLKQKGIGEGKWNGFGGKVEDVDRIQSKKQKLNPYEMAMMREVKEECGLTILNYKQMGKIYFSFDVHQEVFDVHIFLITEFKGEIKKTEEMYPQWFNLSEIPYDDMWLDDRLWLPYLLNHKKIEAYFIFSDESNIVGHQLRVIE